MSLEYFERYLNTTGMYELKENTEFYAVDKITWLAHMAFLKMATLVFPVSMCLGQGLYAELFLFSALNRLQRW